MKASGIANPLANPTLTLLRASDGAVIGSNDNWQTQTNPAHVAQIHSAGFAPAHPLEPALIAALAPGQYTAIVQGAGGGTGTGLVGVYEVDSPETQLVNISVRAAVLPGDDVLISGFIIYGDTPRQIAIVGNGRSLTAQGLPGALPNPLLWLIRGSDGALIGSNDDWQSAPNAAAIQSAGFAPGHPLDSAIMMTLAPGAYWISLKKTDTSDRCQHGRGCFMPRQKILKWGNLAFRLQEAIAEPLPKYTLDELRRIARKAKAQPASWGPPKGREAW